MAASSCIKSIEPKTGYDLWILPREGDRRPFPFARTEFDELGGRFYPAGADWLAYYSGASGQYEVCSYLFTGSRGPRLKKMLDK